MANWCENTLKVIGEEKELKKFVKKIKRKSFLSSFNPTPKELVNTRAPSLKEDINLIIKYGADNWYDWNLKNWGTKWDFEIDPIESIEEGDSEIITYFDSAWSPPIEGFKDISIKYPKITFFLSYEEPGMGFKGLAKIKNGIVDDACFDY